MSSDLSRWKCVCAYDGTDYAGWQSQVTGRAIQDVIEKALSDAVGRKTRIHGSGRTDAGVHAKGQVFHFDVPWAYGGEALRKAMMPGLPKDIQVSTAKKVASSFHARISAKGKRYVYHAFEGQAPPMETRYRSSLPTRSLDLKMMQAASNSLLGEHDFTSFGASHGYPCEENPVKTIWLLEVSRTGKRLQVAVEGSGFLYKMVRSLCGALFDVGRGRLSVSQVGEILDQRERTSLVVTAPSHGLCLEKVFFRRPRK